VLFDNSFLLNRATLHFFVEFMICVRVRRNMDSVAICMLRRAICILQKFLCNMDNSSKPFIVTVMTRFLRVIIVILWWGPRGLKQGGDVECSSIECMVTLEVGVDSFTTKLTTCSWPLWPRKQNVI
jgi:hypothetical protein